MTKLKVLNTDFMVASTIDRCPNTMMLRELIMNSIEASSKSPKNKKINIRKVLWKGSTKLSIWNTGPGMSFTELRDACDIASSIGKENSLDENFGMGAKVASLKANKFGMRFRSCKDGKVAEVVMGQETDPHTRKKFYTRFDYEGNTGTPYPDVLDVTNLCEDEKINLNEDWTEVVLYGNKEKQNTVKNPFDNNPEVPLRWIANALYQRFFKLPEGVSIVLEDGTNSKGGNRTFEPFHERIIRMSKEYSENIRQETVTLEDGIKIHYYFDNDDKSSGGHKFSYKGNVASDISFGGVAYKNEIYGVKRAAGWYVVGPKLGIPFGQRFITVIVEIPQDTNVIPDGYRESIRWNDHQKEHVELEDYGGIVRENIPAWLKEKIEKFSPQRKTSEDIQNHLRELLKNLNVLTKTLLTSRDGKPSSTDDGGNKIKHVREGVRKKLEKNTRPPNRPLSEIQGRDKTKNQDGLQVPNFTMIRTEEQLKDHPDLIDRAAKYETDTNVIFINMLYDSIKMMRISLKKQFASRGTEEEIDNEIEKVLDDSFQIKIGSAVVFALAKKDRTDWDYDEAEKAWSTETLSIISDFWQDDLVLAKDKLNKIFKKLSA